MDLIGKKLRVPFPASAHAMHNYFKFIYLEERPIVDRLTDVLGPIGWDLVVRDYEFIEEGVPVIKAPGTKDTYILADNYPGELVGANGHWAVGGEPVDVVYDIPVVMCYGYMTIRIYDERTGTYIESRRESVGGDALLALGKERGTRRLNTTKGALTDLLKRTARLHGVGQYLTSLEDGVTLNNLDSWISNRVGPTSIDQARFMLVAQLSGKDKPYETPDLLGAAIKSAGYTYDDLFYDFQRVRAELHAAAKAA